MPRKRGIDGPVRSMSRMPTERPARQSDKASCVVTEDLPTPPLPERTCFMTFRQNGKGPEDGDGDGDGDRP